MPIIGNNSIHVTEHSDQRPSSAHTPETTSNTSAQVVLPERVIIGEENGKKYFIEELTTVEQKKQIINKFEKLCKNQETLKHNKKTAVLSSLKDIKDQFEEDINEKNNPDNFLALYQANKNNEAIIGLATFIKLTEEKSIFLTNVVTLPDISNKSKYLFQYLINVSENRSISLVSVSAAKSVYENLGFRCSTSKPSAFIRLCPLIT